MDDQNNNENYLKPDAPTFEVPVPPEQTQQAQPVYDYTPPVQQTPPPVQQMPYTRPVNQPPKPVDGVGIASMILGILSLICCWAYFFGFLLGVVGLILGLCAKRIDGKKSGFAIAGIITSAIGIAIGLLMIALLFGMGSLTLDEFEALEDWSRFEI